MPRNSFEVEMLDKGYEITVWEKTQEDEDFYPDRKIGIAATKEEVAKYFMNWMDNDGMNFDFDSVED